MTYFILGTAGFIVTLLLRHLLRDAPGPDWDD